MCLLLFLLILLCHLRGVKCPPTLPPGHGLSTTPERSNPAQRRKDRRRILLQWSMYLPHPRTQSKTPEIPLFNALASQACVLLLLLLLLLLRLLLHRTRTDQAGRVGHDRQRVVHRQTHEPPTRPARSETLFPVLSSLHCRPLDKMSETQSTAPTPTPCAPSSRLNPLRLHTANQEKRNRDWLRPTHELGRDPLSTTLHPLPERGSKGGSVVAMLSTSLAPVCAPNIETPPRQGCASETQTLCHCATAATSP